MNMARSSRENGRFFMSGENSVHQDSNYEDNIMKHNSVSGGLTQTSMAMHTAMRMTQRLNDKANRN